MDRNMVEVHGPWVHSLAESAWLQREGVNTGAHGISGANAEAWRLKALDVNRLKKTQVMSGLEGEHSHQCLNSSDYMLSISPDPLCT